MESECLGPLWGSLPPERQDFLIEMANTLLASSMFCRTCRRHGVSGVVLRGRLYLTTSGGIDDRLVEGLVDSSVRDLSRIAGL